eukprot:scaffold32022_cov62-Phaeocystis_antarctica.AAC.7
MAAACGAPPVFTCCGSAIRFIRAKEIFGIRSDAVGHFPSSPSFLIDTQTSTLILVPNRGPATSTQQPLQDRELILALAASHSRPRRRPPPPHRRNPCPHRRHQTPNKLPAATLASTASVLLCRRTETLHYPLAMASASIARKKLARHAVKAGSRLVAQRAQTSRCEP